MQDTIDLITRYYAAFNAGDTEAMIACLAPDVAHHVNEGQVRIGTEAFRAFCAHMSRCYDEHLTGHRGHGDRRRQPRRGRVHRERHLP